MLLHHLIHRIVVLPVVCSILAVLEKEHPVYIQAARLDGVFDVFVAGFVEGDAFVPWSNAVTVSLKITHTTDIEADDAKGLLE